MSNADNSQLYRAQQSDITTQQPTGIIAEFVRTGNDEADAAQVRSTFLQKVAPDEWRCYNQEPNPHKKKQLFARTFHIVVNVMNGY